MIEQRSCHNLVGDEGNDAHRAVAPRADENVDAVDSLEQLGPCEAAGALGIVGAAGGAQRGF